MKTEDIINHRCGWAGNDELYTKYHDEEWGRQVTDDKILFEFLILESAQAGLSWITILRKLEVYRQAFSNFEVEKIAEFSPDDIDRLMTFEGIVRNRLKISSAVTNARCFMKVQQEYGSFYNYIISFFPQRKQIQNNYKKLSEVPASSPLSDAISKDMKKRGFKFFGTTICYAFLQATGFIDDHLEACFCNKDRNVRS